MKQVLLISLFFLSLKFSAQVVEELIPLDTASEKIAVIYKPITSTSYYKKQIAVYANDTSKIAIEKTLARGVQNGIYKVFYPSGQLKVKAVYANGKMNGEYTWYGEDGIIRVKGVYKNDVKDGYWAYKYLKIYGRYKNNKRHKTWYTPDANNKKVKSYYRAGKLVKGEGFGYVQLKEQPDTVYQKQDTTVVESVKTDYIKVAEESPYHSAMDFLANNAVFRKTIKTHFKKDIQKFKKCYKSDVFQFKLAESVKKMEINTFVAQSSAGEINVAVIDYILKNQTDSLNNGLNAPSVVLDRSYSNVATNSEAEITVHFSQLVANLMRIDVVWNPLKEVKSQETTFKVLLYFDDQGVLKGATYQ